MEIRMGYGLLGLLVSLLLVLVSLVLWRQFDNRQDLVAWDRLAALAQGGDAVFEPAMVAGLPDPARRYFEYMIAPGTPIRTVVQIEMTGELGRGTKAVHSYQPMSATQILAPPHGLVWKVDAGALGGSDGALPGGSWTRFWLFGLLPVVRVMGDDHQRSAFGRVVAEAAFWAPGSLLPSEAVDWEAIDEDTARAIVRQGTFMQAVDITVASSGAPTQVIIQRWSNENADGVFREQPFGGYPSEYQEFDGYRLPTRVEGGNHFGTPEYFPFFKAVVTSFNMN